jgi:hypothetical protein
MHAEDVKGEREFFATGGLEWSPVRAGVSERVLSRDDADAAVLTRMVRWAAGLDTTPDGVIRHDYFEEVFVLDGDLDDLTLDRTFRAGDYAARRPGMPHGPYRTATGCVMLEVRHR